MIFTYVAKKGPEENIEGKIEAQTEKEAVEKISAMGYIPVRIEEAKEVNVDLLQEKKISPAKKKRIKSRDATLFSRQLASLLRSGVPILSCLSIIADQSANSNFRNVLSSIRNQIKEGARFSSSLGLYPSIFSSLYIAMIRAGEDSGSLPDALLRIAEYRTKQEEMISRFRMALAYPILMALVGVGTVIFMLTFVMPRLMGIFGSMGQSLPLPTQILISVSEALQQWWIWAVVALFVLVGIRQSQTKTGKIALSAFRLKMPLFGSLILKSQLSRFSRTMELLLKSGIPILKALDIAIPVIDNEIVKKHLQQSRKDLEQGGSFGRSLKVSRIFPLFMTNLLIVGEESGKLEEALREVADSYERDTDEAVRVMTSLLEPLMILVMGIIVGFLVVAMLLPVFEMNVIVQ